MSAAAAPATGSAAPVVLVAEDEVMIAEAIGWILEDAGYTPLLAADGVQALALARQHWPALLIADLMMPQMDGIALIAALRQEAAATGRAVPLIVMMTAAGRQYAQKQATELGVDAVLPKPFDISQLEALVDRLLRPPAR